MTARPIAFDVIEDCVTAWVTRASGLDDQHIFWSHQFGTRNDDSPYIVMQFPEVRRYGKDWSRLDATDRANPVMITEGPRTLNLYIQCFGNSQIGDESAKSILETICALVNAPSQQKLFRAAKIGIGVISNITSPYGSENFEPRSYVNIEVNCGATLREPVSLIEHVEVTINAGPIIRIPKFVEAKAEITTDDASADGSGSVT